MAPNKLMIIVVLAVILIAGGAAIVLMTVSPSTNTPSSTETSAVVQTTPSSGNFDTTVLQRSDYVALDFGLITQGRLPVAPPSGTGKANPFQ